MGGITRTSRLTLRHVQPEDASAVSALMSPAVSRWLLSWPVPYTRGMAADRIAQARTGLADGTMLPFVIERLSDTALLGWLSVTCTSARRALLSYWLGEAYQGQGYMREALTAALPAAFTLLDVDAIDAEVQAGNAASLALLQAHAMRPVGERMTFSPARNRHEPCLALELQRPRP